MILIVGYLPPENSKCGRDSTSFFANITSEIYRLDLIVMAADSNARIGNL